MSAVEAQIVDGSADEIHGAELVRHAAPQQPSTLFRTDDPVEVIEKATTVAVALKSVIVNRQLTKRISGRDHVLVEGWTTLGSMLGVFPIKEWVRELPWPEPCPAPLKALKDRGLTYGFVASYRSQRADGTVVGGAESECRRSEGTWKTRDDYALKSMAQTRATSKSLRVPLGFIITLAGYDATPAEEADGARETQRETPTAPSEPLPEEAVKELAGLAQDLIKAGAWDARKLTMTFVAAGATDTSGVEQALRTLTPTQADELKSTMVDLLAATGEQS